MRTTATAAAAVLMTLGAATPASAAGSSSASAKVRLAVAAPSRGSTVADTAQLDFTGANLTAVTIYRVARPIATATVTPDGTAAHALVDTTRFPDGPLLLTAVGRGGSAGRQVAVAPMLVRVDNAHADRHPAGYRLVFRDEFGGAGLDRSKWCTRYQYDGGPAPQVPDPACLSTDPATGATLGTLDTLGGDGTQQGQESEVYRDVNNVGKTMHTQQDGYLSLHATATRADQPYLKYESAMIRSKREYQPTAEHPLYLTARVRLPDVLGTWPAFWLAGGYGDGRVRPPWPPEIDILEGPLNNHGNTANVLWTAVQTWGCDGPCPQGPVQATYADPRWDGNAYKADASLRDRWIEVGLEWHPDHVCWYLDGGKFGCVTYRWVANDGPDATNPASVLLNLGVGGPWAGADGVDDAKFPAHYDIDHVRIYAR